VRLANEHRRPGAYLGIERRHGERRQLADRRSFLRWDPKGGDRRRDQDRRRAVTSLAGFLGEPDF